MEIPKWAARELTSRVVRSNGTHFKETPAHSSYDWHPAPEKQFVITLSGTLEFVTPDGEKFIVRPGDVLAARGPNYLRLPGGGRRREVSEDLRRLDRLC